MQGHPLTLCWIANELRLRDRHNPYVGYLLNNLHSLSQLGGQYRENLNWNGQQLLNWNFQRLPLELQKTLAQLSILQQPFTCIMATDVAGRPIHTDDLREIERRTLIEELKESDQYGNKQFQLLPVTAQFLQQQLTEPDRQNAHTGALKYYRAIAKRSGWKTFDDCKEILQIVHHACELLQYGQAFKEIWHEEKHKNLDEFLKSQSHNLFRKELYTSLAQAWEANLTPQDWTDYALLLNCLGSAYQDLGDYKQADAYYRSAFEKLNCGIADTGITVAGMAEALLGIADAQMGLADTRMMGLRIVEPLAGRFKTAEECYRNAVDLFQCTPPISSSKALEGLAKAWLGLSKICCSKAQYTDAISLIYREVLPKFKELNDRVGQARSWNVLGYANQGLKNFKQAIYWHEKVLTVFNGSENRLEQVDALSGLGASYSAIKDYKLDGDFYNKVQKFSTEIGHSDFYAKASEGLKQLETVKTDTPSPPNGNHSKRGEDGRDSNSEAFIAFASILSFAAAFFLSYLLIMLGMRGWTPFTFRATLPWVVPSPAPRLSPVFRSDPDALPQLLIQFRRGDG